MSTWPLLNVDSADMFQHASQAAPSADQIEDGCVLCYISWCSAGLDSPGKTHGVNSLVPACLKAAYGFSRHFAL